MTANERLTDMGYEGVIVFSHPGYDDALIGVTENNRAVYDFEKMVDCLVRDDGMSEEEAVEWIEYNAVRSLPYLGAAAPIIMYPLP